jgi:hypothetical protein
MFVGTASRGDAGDVMSEVSNVSRMLEMAARAATIGDLASAEELLRGAARLQEDALGPLHPDLANTLNNLAIVAEKAGRPGEAETFYRRAVAIASASLPSDHPMVAASRENLEAFCRARGLPIDLPVVITPPAADMPPAKDAIESHGLPAAVEPRAAREPHAEPQPHSPRGSQSLTAMAIGAVVLVAAALFAWRPWSSREPSLVPPTIEPAAPRAAEPAPPPRIDPPPAVPAPIEQSQPPVAATPGKRRDAVSNKPPDPIPSASPITLATTQLCQTFSTSGGRWRCDPATDPVSAGPVVLYIRVKSARDVEVVQLWYRGDVLRQSVKLKVRASPQEGYRTYSRQTVDSGADWRVEVRSVDGELLHERRFAVQ